MKIAAAYEPTRESLNGHPMPGWFEDAKFGVFIHWGLFSVPGFAPPGVFSDTLRNDYRRAMVVHPYAEDYWNAIKDPSTPSAAFHRATYGDMPYRGFKQFFVDALEQWDPDDWAETFHRAGGRYVVLVAKYHDGFCLWPTTVPNPHEPNWHTERDVVGELAEAVRARGMRFGVYYSGGVDWTFRRRVSRSLGDYTYSCPGGSYPAYAVAHVRELIDRYQPDILWNDISWPTGLDEVFKLFAYYYERVPEGVVNDRWRHTTPVGRLMRLKPARMAFDAMVSMALKRKPDMLDGIVPPAIPHSDFTTPEYTKYDSVQEKKWEMTRGMGGSFGYNREETDEHYESAERLMADFVDAVSKNGNLLLNVGPRGEDTSIPPEQAARLAAFGAWLDVNGDAVYATRPWTTPEATTEDGMPVRTTADGNAVNLILVGRPTGTRFRIPDLVLDGKGRRLADGSEVGVEADSRGGTVLTFAEPLHGDFSPAITVTQARRRARVV